MVVEHTLALDPGIRGSGCALFAHMFEGRRLVRAWYEPNPNYGEGMANNTPLACVGMATAIRSATRWAGIDDIAIEWPQVYKQGMRGGDPNDLLALVGIGVAFCALTPKAKYTRYLPKTWKGTIPKGEAFEERVDSRLSEAERDRFESIGALDHNIYDAIGIGLHHLGRFTKRRVIAR